MATLNKSNSKLHLGDAPDATRAPSNNAGDPTNRLRVRIPWLLEVDGDGLVPVIGAFLLCAMVIIWLALR